MIHSHTRNTKFLLDLYLQDIYVFPFETVALHAVNWCFNEIYKKYVKRKFHLSCSHITNSHSLPLPVKELGLTAKLFGEPMITAKARF